MVYYGWTSLYPPPSPLTTSSFPFLTSSDRKVRSSSSVRLYGFGGGTNICNIDCIRSTGNTPRFVSIPTINVLLSALNLVGGNQYTCISDSACSAVDWTFDGADSISDAVIANIS